MGDKKCLGDGDGFWDKCGEVVEWSERVVVTAFGCGEVVEWSERVVVTVFGCGEVVEWSG